MLLIRPTTGDCGLLSPNGKWVAYVSNESGRAEVYVDSYPSLAEKIAVSTDGGHRPRWSRDGRELFYRQGDALMAVSVVQVPVSGRGSRGVCSLVLTGVRARSRHSMSRRIVGGS